MKKRIFTIAIAMIMTLSAVAVSGCGNNDNSVEKTTETTVSAETTSAVEESSSIEETTTNDIEETTAEVDSTEPTQETTKKVDDKKSDKSNKSENKNNSSNSSNSSTPKNVAVTSVSLSKNSMTITEGDSQSFEVYINPSSATDRQYNVVTNNGNATVSCNGSIVTVYAKNKGNCEITVSSTNGKSAVCYVTVKTKSSSNSNAGNNSNNNSGGGSNKNNQTITDDTLLTHAQICTDSTMKKVCDAVNNYFVNTLKMKYNSSLNKNNCGWFLSGTNYYLGDYYYSVNKIVSEESDGFEQELYALIDCDNWTTREDIPLMSFRCYYEKQSNGEYYIYFCHY